MTRSTPAEAACSSRSPRRRKSDNWTNIRCRRLEAKADHVNSIRSLRTGLGTRLALNQGIDNRRLGGRGDAMAHRGQDDDGLRVNSTVALAMGRRSIIDVEGGPQPICNEDG